MALFLRIVLVALVAALITAAEARERIRVLIYTASEPDELVALKRAIERDVAGVEIAWVRDSTGVITARLIAERGSPRADLVFGLVTSSMILLERMNLLEPYRPKGVDELKRIFRDPLAPYTWTGLDAFVTAICFNREEAARRAVPEPQTWADLAKPVYRDRIVMPHPASSGTGFLLVSTWIQLMGEEAAWRFMEALHDNVALYTHSGSAPCVQASRGERVLGLSFDMRGAREKSLGAPIDILIPKDGTGWEMGALAILRGRPPAQAEAARRIADWATSRAAHELFSRYYGIVGRPGISAPPNYPPEAEQRMAPMNIAWMADNRDRILAEWSRRFDTRQRN